MGEIERLPRNVNNFVLVRVISKVVSGWLEANTASVEEEFLQMSFSWNIECIESQHTFSLYSQNTNYFSYFDDKETVEFIAKYLSQNWISISTLEATYIRQSQNEMQQKW